MPRPEGVMVYAHHLVASRNIPSPTVGDKLGNSFRGAHEDQVQETCRCRHRFHHKEIHAAACFLSNPDAGGEPGGGLVWCLWTNEVGGRGNMGRITEWFSLPRRSEGVSINSIASPIFPLDDLPGRSWLTPAFSCPTGWWEGSRGVMYVSERGEFR